MKSFSTNREIDGVVQFNLLARITPVQISMLLCHVIIHWYKEKTKENRASKPEEDDLSHNCLRAVNKQRYFRDNLVFHQFKHHIRNMYTITDNNPCSRYTFNMKKSISSWSEWQSKKFGSDSMLHIRKIICAWFELIRRPKQTDCMDADIEWDTSNVIIMMMEMNERQSHCWQWETKGANRYGNNITRISWNFCTINFFFLTFVRFTIFNYIVSIIFCR